MVAFKYRMPAGIPGDVNRVEAATIEAQQLVAAANADHPAEFGLALVLDAASKLVRRPKAGDTVASILGFLVREYPTQAQSPAVLTGGVPGDGGPCSVLRRGYMTVKLRGATAAVKRGAVFVRMITGTSTVIGAVEAAADGVNTLALTNAFFTGPADADGNVEIEFNL